MKTWFCRSYVQVQGRRRREGNLPAPKPEPLMGDEKVYGDAYVRGGDYDDSGDAAGTYGKD